MSLGVPQLKGGEPSKPVTGSATGNPRNKTALKPGRSLMDWIRLGQKEGDLAGVGGRHIDVTVEELAKHNTEADAWTAIKGTVYNLTPYLEFHPGGVDELMRCAGIDGTELFDEVHAWVNYQSMLAKCRVGKLVTESKRGSSTSLNKPTANGRLSVGFAMPAPPTGGFAQPLPATPRYEWFQTSTHVTIAVYTKGNSLRHEDIVIEKHALNLHIHVFVGNEIFTIAMALENSITDHYEVKVSKSSPSKVEICLRKEAASKQWSSLGQPLEGNKQLIKIVDKEREFHTCRVSKVQKVTHDTKLYKIQLPKGYRMCVPLGYHVYVSAQIEDVAVTRAYTVVPPSLLADRQDPDVAMGTALYLMVKVYSDGALTGAVFRDLQAGDEIEISKLFDGNFHMEKLEKCSNVVLLAAGTGFTPMAHIILETIEKNTLFTKPFEKRNVTLVFFNKTVEDILWKDQLEQVLKKHKNFQVHNVLSNPHSGWEGLTGRIRKDVIAKWMPSDGRVLVCACGPTGFTNEAIRLAQEEFECEKEMTHAFLA